MPRVQATRGRRSRCGTARARGRSRDPLPQARRLPGRAARRAARASFDERARSSTSTRSRVALWVKNQGIVGAAATSRPRRRPRRATAAGRLRDREALLTREQFFAAMDGVEKPWLFPRLGRDQQASGSTSASRLANGHHGRLPAAHAGVRARRREGLRARSCTDRAAARRLVMPIIRRFDPEGCTDEVRFLTRKVVMDPTPTKSPLNHVVLDGLKGNTWEEGLAQTPRARPTSARRTSRTSTSGSRSRTSTRGRPTSTSRTSSSDS